MDAACCAGSMTLPPRRSGPYVLVSAQFKKPRGHSPAYRSQLQDRQERKLETGRHSAHAGHT